MKTRIISRIFFSGIILALIFSTSSCNDNDEGPVLTAELIGSWPKSFGGSDGCTQTYTFRSNNYTYFESCFYTGNVSFDEEVAELFEAEKMFRTPDKMYMAWHVDGSKLYLHKTNPGDPKPVLGANWWTNYSPFSKK